MSVQVSTARFAIFAAACLLTVGSAAAAAGSLPSAAQDALAGAAAHAGVELPSSTGNPDGGAANANEHASDSVGQQGARAEHGGGTVQSHAQGDHGAAVSAVAQSTEPGPGHGQAVRDVASSTGQSNRSPNATSHGGSSAAPQPNANATEHRAPQAADAGGGRPEGAGKPA